MADDPPSTPPAAPNIPLDKQSPRIWGPFCEAWSLYDHERECGALAHVTVYFTLANGGRLFFGHFCDRCWANPRLHPQQPFVARRVEGWHPSRRG